MKTISTDPIGSKGVVLLGRLVVTQIVSRSAIVMIHADGSSRIAPGLIFRSTTLPATGAFSESNCVDCIPSAGMTSAHSRAIRAGSASDRWHSVASSLRFLSGLFLRPLAVTLLLGTGADRGRRASV